MRLIKSSSKIKRSQFEYDYLYESLRLKHNMRVKYIIFHLYANVDNNINQEATVHYGLTYPTDCDHIFCFS